MKFTDKFIDNLKPKEKMFQIREGEGFGIRVLPSGHKLWIFTYTYDGKRRQMNLGTYLRAPKEGGIKPKVEMSLADARIAYSSAYATLHDKQNPRDPQEERDNRHNRARKQREDRRKAPTISKLIEEYINRHAKRFKRSWEKDQAILNRDVLPIWGEWKAEDVKKRDVVQLLEGIVDRGAPAMANNCFQIIRKMFNWAVEKDILPHTPCTGVKLPSPKLSRERTLSEAEIKTMWDNLDKCAMSDEIRRALKLILVTAQRPGEVIGMHSSEIDGQWWTIPAERAKNGNTHRVYLTKTALDLIGPLQVPEKKTGEMKAKGFIFKTPHTTKEQAMAPQALIVAVARGFAFPVLDEKGNQLFTKEGKPATENRIGINHFTPHDLRRTAATFMAEMGTMDEVIDAILNHAKQGVIKVYNQYRYDKEKQSAFETWERKLISITAGKTGKVIPITRAAELT